MKEKPMSFRPRKSLALLLATTCVGLGLTVSLLGADKPEKAQPADQSLMRRKLEHSKNILEGLALENFDQVKKEGQSLKLLSTIDLWRKYDTPFYNQISGNFRAAVDKMI